VKLTEWGKSVKVAPNEVKFASTCLWSSLSYLWRANNIIVEIHTQQNSPHGFTVLHLTVTELYPIPSYLTGIGLPRIGVSFWLCVSLWEILPSVIVSLLTCENKMSRCWFVPYEAPRRRRALNAMYTNLQATHRPLLVLKLNWQMFSCTREIERLPSRTRVGRRLFPYSSKLGVFVDPKEGTYKLATPHPR